jgi:cytochrome c biogenesis protein CcmG/thiol:disulfide interchange protein DsbE
MKKTFIPLFIFMVLLGFLIVGLQRDPKELPSQFVNQNAPAFKTTLLNDTSGKSFGPEDMLGKVWLLNVFASWCTACLIEHPLLLDIHKNKVITIVGLNYKDKPEDAKKWLDRRGNPYQLVAVDSTGKIGIDYGVYGVPESYLIDKKGVIRDKIVGPITPNIWNDRLLSQVEKLSKE